VTVASRLIFYFTDELTLLLRLQCPQATLEADFQSSATAADIAEVSGLHEHRSATSSGSANRVWSMHFSTQESNSGNRYRWDLLSFRFFCTFPISFISFSFSFFT